MSGAASVAVSSSEMLAGLDEGDHPRPLGWAATTAMAMGGSNQSLFLISALVASQGSAAVPLLIVGLLLAWAALPSWLELILLRPGAVGGVAAVCSKAFRPYSPVLANLTGVCYWWGWVPTCGLTALLSASALHSWALPMVPPVPLAVGLVLLFMLVNLAGVRWVGRVALPVAIASGGLAFLSATVPVFAGNVDWHQALSFSLVLPFPGWFGALTSAMAGLYLVGFAAPAFEAASCHVGEMRDPARNVPRAMYASAATASVYFVVLPVVWLGVLGSSTLTHELANVLGPTFAPLFGGAAKGAALLFMILNMFHGTLQPLAGAARTLSQLAEDGLLPRTLARRTRTDAPLAATLLTAAAAIVFLLAGDPIWLVAAANFTYLIGIGLPSVAAWLLRRNEPDHPRLYRAPRGTLELGMLAAGVWCFSAVLGFEQYGLPTVLFGLALAYSGSVAYAWRSWSDRRRAGLSTSVRSMHLKLTGAMLLVLALDGAGYLLAVRSAEQREPSMVSALQDIFVAVAMLTISVGLVLPGMIAHATSEVMRAADDLARNLLPDLAKAMEALSRGELTQARSHRSPPPVVVHSADEVGAMATSFNAMLDEVERTEHALDGAAERLRMYTDGLEELVSERTRALVVANAALREAQAERRTLLARTVRAGEEERTRVAADLHDGPIQRLAGLGLMLDRCELRLARGDADGSGELVAAARSEISDQIRGLRRLMSELRPPVLDQGGLPAALSDHLSTFRSRYGVAGELRIDLGAPLEAQIETTVYRLVQESLTNVGKHAAADSVVVEIREEKGGLAVQVEDDGTGMALTTGMAATEMTTIDMAQLLRDGHCGLAGMRERVELVGGRFALGRGARGGTCVSFWLPRAASTVPAQAVALP